MNFFSLQIGAINCLHLPWNVNAEHGTLIEDRRLCYINVIKLICVNAYKLCSLLLFIVLWKKMV